MKPLNSRFVGAIVMTVLLSACSLPTPPPAITDDDIFPATEPPAYTRPVPRRVVEEVAIEPGMAWLYEPVSLGSRSAPASAAIRVVVGERPLRFDLHDANRNPTVENARSATTAREHLDSLVAQADWVWIVEAGVVVVRDRIVEMVDLDVTPGIRTTTTGIDGLGNSRGGQGGGGAATNTLIAPNDPYEALANSLEALGFTGGDAAGATTTSPEFLQDERTRCADGKYEVLAYTGMAVLSGCPSRVRQGRRVVERFNAGHYRSAVAEVTVFEIDFSQGRERSLDLNLLRQTANRLGVQIEPAGTTTGSAGLTFDWQRPNDRLMGSEAMLRWLQTQGQTSTRLHRRVELTHNEMSTIRDVRIVPYVREVSVTNQFAGASSNVTPSVTIEDALSGFVLSILPTIPMSSDTVSMRMNLSRASLVDNLSYSFADGLISGSVPVLAQQDDVVTVSLADGEAAIVSSVTLRDSRSSIGRFPVLPVIGDEVMDSESQSDFVLLVSVVMEQ